MKIRDYLAETDQAKKLISFADASLLFKENCKCLDGFAFDFDEKINAIKLYIKLYKYKLIDLEDFINKFSENNRFKKLYYSNVAKIFKGYNQKSLRGINLSIKYNLHTDSIIKSIYFSTNNKTSICISDNLSIRKYHYIYNKPLIKLINKVLKLNIPNHNEALELSARRESIDATVYPRLRHEDLLYSSQYCSNLKFLLKNSSFEKTQNNIISQFKEDINSFVTKGYKNSSKQEKIYFGHFDWKSSIFS